MIPLPESSRRFAFRILNTLKGGGVLSASQEVGAFYANESTWPEIRMDRFHRLITFTQTCVPFYSAFSCDSLQDFPVTDKGLIRSRGTESFISSSSSTKKHQKVTTSGSSGQPFTCYHDAMKARQKLSDLLYYNGLAGYKVGMRHLLIRATRKPSWKLWLQNEVWLDPTQLSPAFLETTRQHLRSKKTKIAIGYPSVMAELASHCRECGDTLEEIPLLGYIATSELIIPNQRDLIRETFGCKVVSRYACEEFGVLGQSGEDCERFELNTHSFIIEILKLNENVPASAGEIGRVVVTDLFNYAMPFIRYDTGDLAISDEDSDQNFGVTSLRSLQGKQADSITDTHGGRIAPLAILVAFKSFKGIDQFQFAQVGNGRYVLRITPETATLPEGVHPSLKEILGQSAEIQVKNFHEIPSLPSGKKPIVRNEIP